MWPQDGKRVKREAAARSRIAVRFGCRRKAEAGTCSLTLPSKACATASAFAGPVARRTHRRASSRVAMPTVMACVGTGSAPKAGPIGRACRFAEGHDPGSRIEGGARFVEGDVAVATDPEQREVDPARVGNGAFIGGGRRVQIGLRRRWRVRTLGREVDMLKQGLAQESTKARRVTRGNPTYSSRLNTVARANDTSAAA